MPDSLRATLKANLLACLDQQRLSLEDMSSDATGEEYCFPALHFSWYNRHGMRVSAVRSQFHYVANHTFNRVMKPHLTCIPTSSGRLITLE